MKFSKMEQIIQARYLEMAKEQVDNNNEQNESIKKSVRNMMKSEVTLTNNEGKEAKVCASELFNGILDTLTAQFTDSIIQDDLKPKYRFIQSRVTSNNLDDAKKKDNITLVDGDRVNTEYEEAFEKLDKTGYSVEVIEDFENKNSTGGDRYIIRITDSSGVYADINLAKYREDILSFDFDEEEFIARILKKIDGSLFNELYPLAHLIAECISLTIYDRNKYTLLYSKLGWDRHDKTNKRFFKYDKVITMLTGVKGKLMINNVESIKESSDYDIDRIKWILFTKKLMMCHEYDALIFGAGVSGIIRQLLDFTKETNINVNIQGNSGAGKSMIGHYILSFFGNPIMLEGTAIDTENAMEEIRTKRNILPYVLDERMLRVFGESENKKKITVLLEIFREYEGKTKERVGKQYEGTAGDRTYGPIISSSVEAMMDYVKDFNDLGQFRRFIELNIGNASDKILFNREEALIADTFAYKYYGFGVRFIAEYLIEKMYNYDTYVIDRFNKLDKQFNDKLSKKQNELGLVGLVSSSKRFALIVLSYQIIEEALLYKMFGMLNKYDNKSINNKLDLEWEKDLFSEIFNSYETSNDDIDAFINNSIDQTISLKVYDILEDNIINKMKYVNELKKIDFNFLEFYISNKDAFFNGDKNKDNWNDEPDKYIGRAKKVGDNKITLIFKRTLAVHRLLLGQGNTDLATIREYVRKFSKIEGNNDEIIKLQKEYGLIDTKSFDSYCKTSDGIELEEKQKNYCFNTEKIEASVLINIDIPEKSVVKEEK